MSAPIPVNAPQRLAPEEAAKTLDRLVAEALERKKAADEEAARAEEAAQVKIAVEAIARFREELGPYLSPGFQAAIGFGYAYDTNLHVAHAVATIDGKRWTVYRSGDTGYSDYQPVYRINPPGNGYHPHVEGPQLEREWLLRIADYRTEQAAASEREQQRFDALEDLDARILQDGPYGRALEISRVSGGSSGEFRQTVAIFDDMGGLTLVQMATFAMDGPRRFTLSPEETRVLEHVIGDELMRLEALAEERAKQTGGDSDIPF